MPSTDTFYPLIVCCWSDLGPACGRTQHDLYASCTLCFNASDLRSVGRAGGSPPASSVVGAVPYGDALGVPAPRSESWITGTFHTVITPSLVDRPLGQPHRLLLKRTHVTWLCAGRAPSARGQRTALPVGIPPGATPALQGSSCPHQAPSAACGPTGHLCEVVESLHIALRGGACLQSFPLW